MKKKKSWKTTLGGFLAAVGLLMSTEPLGSTLPAPIPAIGTVLAAVGAVLVGYSATDQDAVKPDAIKTVEPKPEGR